MIAPKIPQGFTEHVIENIGRIAFCSFGESVQTDDG